MDIDRVRKELQESALREFPNPERVGCPDAETLAGMSRRIIQMTQDQLHHVTHCSPCFQTFLAIRQEMRQRRVMRIRIAAVACAAAIVLGAVIYWTGAFPTNSHRPNRQRHNSGHSRPSTVNRESWRGAGTHEPAKASTDPSEKTSAAHSLLPGRCRRRPVRVAVARWPVAHASKAACDSNAPGSHRNGCRGTRPQFFIARSPHPRHQKERR